MREIKSLTTLNSLIEVAKKFASGEWNADQIGEYGQTMQIRQYIPMLEKTAIVTLLMGIHMDEYQFVEVSTTELQKELFFYVLLERYAFVDCSDIKLVTYENYDLLYPLFYPFIISFCRDDYEVIKEMLRDSINASNLYNILKNLNNLNTENMRELVNANHSIYRDFMMNRDLIEKINNIIAVNDPGLNELWSKIKTQAVGDAKQ